MAMAWMQGLATGVAVIDEQHRGLFQKVNALLDACQQGKGKDEIGQVLDFLKDYTVTHFRAEEGLMTAYQYPDVAAHKAKHAVFIENIDQLRARFENDGASSDVILATNRFVVDWLLNHIRIEDSKVGAFLRPRLNRGS